MSKVLSIIPTIISLVACYIYYKSSGMLGEIHAALIGFIFMFIAFPLSMIWFPDTYVNKTNWIFRRLSIQKGAIFLYGWLLLLIPMAVLIIGVYRLI